MRIGTKSVLFGVHQFLIHPWFVAWAWFKLYGFRRVDIGPHRMLLTDKDGLYWGTGREYASLLRPALWIAFFVHDLGYLGKPNMDGPEGETHPEVGAFIMYALFGRVWSDFTLYHSRFLAKQRGRTPSALCIADKLAIILPPDWFYLLFANLTGEIDEYMSKSDRNNGTGAKYAHIHPSLTSQREWHSDMCAYVARWVEEHKDGRADTWTPAVRAAATPSGVLQ